MGFFTSSASQPSINQTYPVGDLSWQGPKPVNDNRLPGNRATPLSNHELPSGISKEHPVATTTEPIFSTRGFLPFINQAFTTYLEVNRLSDS